MKSMLKCQPCCLKNGALHASVGKLSRIHEWIAALAMAPVAMLALCKFAWAMPAASCAGAVMMGAATLMCSDSHPEEPPQICTYSWALMTADGVTKVVDGSFLISAGTANLQVYSANGYSTQLTGPIVLCRENAPATDPAIN